MVEFTDITKFNKDIQFLAAQDPKKTSAKIQGNKLVKDEKRSSVFNFFCRVVRLIWKDSFCNQKLDEVTQRFLRDAHDFKDSDQLDAKLFLNATRNLSQMIKHNGGNRRDEVKALKVEFVDQIFHKVKEVKNERELPAPAEEQPLIDGQNKEAKIPKQELLFEDLIHMAQDVWKIGLTEEQRQESLQFIAGKLEEKVNDFINFLDQPAFACLLPLLSPDLQVNLLNQALLECGNENSKKLELFISQAQLLSLDIWKEASAKYPISYSESLSKLPADYLCAIVNGQIENKQFCHDFFINFFNTDDLEKISQCITALKPEFFAFKDEPSVWENQEIYKKFFTTLSKLPISTLFLGFSLKELLDDNPYRTLQLLTDSQCESLFFELCANNLKICDHKEPLFFYLAYRLKKLTHPRVMECIYYLGKCLSKDLADDESGDIFLSEFFIICEGEPAMVAHILNWLSSLPNSLLYRHTISYFKRLKDKIKLNCLDKFSIDDLILHFRGDLPNVPRRFLFKVIKNKQPQEMRKLIWSSDDFSFWDKALENAENLEGDTPFLELVKLMDEPVLLERLLEAPCQIDDWIEDIYSEEDGLKRSQTMDKLVETIFDYLEKHPWKFLLVQGSSCADEIILDWFEEKNNKYQICEEIYNRYRDVALSKRLSSELNMAKEALALFNFRNFELLGKPFEIPPLENEMENKITDCYRHFRKMSPELKEYLVGFARRCTPDEICKELLDMSDGEIVALVFDPQAQQKLRDGIQHAKNYDIDCTRVLKLLETVTSVMESEENMYL